VTDHDYRPLDPAELYRLAGEQLPERTAMSLVNANVAAPVNLAAGLNVASDHATAVADASQTGAIHQGNATPIDPGTTPGGGGTATPPHIVDPSPGGSAPSAAPVGTPPLDATPAPIGTAGSTTDPLGASALGGGALGL
jgi:hypothetical protein